MPIINRIAEFHDEIVEWRQDFHRHPELMFDTHRTSARVVELLESFGVDEVVTGLGRTGVVGVIKGRNGGSGKVVGLRADMDALPITERTGKPYASENAGKMHACGHDGHTAMLLGAAKYLAETRNFEGTAVVIFQPAEEGGGGGKVMVEDGLMTRFGIDEVYGMHNFPGQAPGTFAIRSGGIMAATDVFKIEIEGVGGHAAQPHKTVDPIMVSAQLIVALQTFVSRNTDPVSSAVLSVTVINAGTTDNVIPRTASITGTIRTLDEAVRNSLQARLERFVPRFAEDFGARASVDYWRGYPVTVNAPDQTAFAADVAEDVVGSDKVNRAANPSLGGEDFAYMLNERPGAYIMLGQGESAGLHEDGYDFNDEIIPTGVSYWVRLVEKALPIG